MTCEICGGSGWRIVEKKSRPWARPDGDGWRYFQNPAYTGAERCVCSVPVPEPKIAPGLQKIVAVVQGLAELIPFFPQTELALKLIVSEIGCFCDDEKKLEVWAREAVRYFEKYKGVATLRALYCSMYRPADGHYVPVVHENERGGTLMGLPGYTEEELLEQYLKNETAGRSEAELRYAQLAPPDAEPFPLPEVKRIGGSK
jgi:hypothetical protein